MKNNSKRILALLLAIVMCVSCVVPVFAETTHNHDEHETSGTIDKTKCQYRIDDKGTHIYVEGATDHLELREEVLPDCENAGYSIYQCVECGTPVLNTSEAITEAKKHVWGEPVITAPTCGNPGTEVRTCTLCGAVDTKEIEAPEHVYGDWVINTDENGNQYVCGNENAYRARTCTECGHVDKETLNTECKYDYSKPNFIEPPKCNEKGKATYTCENCGNEKTVEVLPYGYPDNVHDWVLKGDYVKAPTCGTDGEGYAICKICGKDYTNEETGNLYTFADTATDEGHVFSKDVPAKDATCAEQGYDAHKACIYCGQSEPGVKYYEATGHGTLKMNAASEPSCVAPGMKAHYVCTVCGAYFDEDKNETTKEALITAPAIGHDYDLENNKPTKHEAPTCTTYGYDIYCCTKCGMLADINDSKGIVVLDRLEHKWVVDTDKSYDVTCDKDGYKYSKCEVCGEENIEITVTTGHITTETRVEANCSTPAYTKVECSRCGYSEKKDFGTETNPDNHDLQTRITTPAPCGQYGVKVTYCANPLCDEPVKEEKFKVEHEWKLNETLSSEPTCAAPGANVYECDLCGETKSESIDALEHVWPESMEEGEYVQIIAPSCGQPGRIVYTCAGCGAQSTQKGEDFDPLNPAHHGANGKPTWACHNPKHVYYIYPDGSTGTEPCDCHETTIYRPGNCYTYELVQYVCTVCDVRYHVVTEGTGPSYDEVTGELIHQGKVVDIPAQAPTCDAAGWTEAWHCTSCGEYKDSTVIPMVVDHANKYLVEAKEDTCGTVGNLEYWHCPDCDKYFVGDEILDNAPIIDDIQHDYQPVAATCADGGIAAHYECSICGELFKLEADGSYTVVTLDELRVPMDHTNFVETNFDGSCLAEAFRHNICLDCGKEYIDLYKAAIGHNYAKVPYQAPTCTVPGWEEHYICRGCGELFNLVGDEYVAITEVPTLEVKHFNGVENFENKCTDNPEGGKLCVACGIDYTDEGHSFKDNTVEPSCEIDGYYVKVCEYCDYSYRDGIIRATGHNPEMVEIKAADVFENGFRVYMCACGQYFKKDADGNDVKVNTMDEASIEVIEALGGLNFDFAIENAIHAGAAFVNGGKIKLTISYKAGNVDLASVAIRLNYNSKVLTYDKDNSNFVCDAKDAAGNKIFVTADVGGATPGFVVVSASTFGFKEEPADKTFYGSDVFAELYFDINPHAVAGSTFDFELDTESNLSATKILKADKTEVEATFGDMPADNGIDALADIANNGAFDNADELEFLAIAFSSAYNAAADINQDGIIGSEDYEFLRLLLLGEIPYDQLCSEVPQKK